MTQWQADGTAQDLGTLGGQWSVAWGMNDHGTVVGESATASGANPAFRTTASGMVQLPPLSGVTVGCAAYDINNLETTAGECRGLATLWRQDGSVIDLNTLIDPSSEWRLGRANRLSDAGHIVGMGTLHGARRGFLLIPLQPTPPSLTLILNQSSFTPGQTLRMALEMHNPGPLLTTDVYVGVILRDREQVVFLTNLSPLEGELTTLSSDPRRFARLLQGVSWPAGINATQDNYWIYTRSGLEANGTYQLIVAWTKPNSLQDGSIDEGDILALDWKAFQFTGPASNLAAKAQEIRAPHTTE